MLFVFWVLAIATAAILTGAGALSMVKPQLSSRCFVPTTSTDFFEFSFYSIFAVIIAAGAHATYLLVQVGAVKPLFKVCLWWALQNRVVVGFSAMLAVSSFLAAEPVNISLIWAMFIPALPVGMGFFDVFMFMPGSHRMFIAVANLSPFSLCFLSVSLYIYGLSQNSPCLGPGTSAAASSYKSDVMFFGKILLAFSAAAFQIATFKLYAKKVVHPARPAVNYHGRRFVDEVGAASGSVMPVVDGGLEDGDDHKGGSDGADGEGGEGGEDGVGSGAHGQVALVLTKSLSRLVHPARGRLAALRKGHDGGGMQVLRFALPSDRATWWAQWLSAACALLIAGLCAAVAVANFAGFTYISAGKCFQVDPGNGLPSGLVESRVTVFVLTVVLGSLAFLLLCGIPPAVMARFLVFWVSRQKILFALIMPLWFIARALVRDTVRNDVALLLAPLVISSLDLMSVVVGRGSRLFSVAIRIMALCLAADFVSVYVVGVAVKFECGAAQGASVPLVTFFGVKASEFLNSIFCVELITIFARKVKEPVGVSVSFSDHSRFVVVNDGPIR